MSPTAAAAPFHGLRTTKKVYEGQEEYRKYPYLQGGGATSEQWQQVTCDCAFNSGRPCACRVTYRCDIHRTSLTLSQTSGTRETRFHLGFYRQPVVFPHPPTQAEAAFALEKSDRKSRNMGVRQETLVK